MTIDDTVAGERPGPDPARRRARLLRASTGVLAVLAALLALACVVVLIWPTAVPGKSAAEKADDRAVAAQSAATRIMKAFLDVDYRDMDPRVNKVLSLSTGTFKNQYQTASADLKSQVEAAKTVATGAVLRVGIGDIDADTAVVYVAADSKVSNTSIEKEKAQGQDANGRRYYRFQLTLSKVGGRWLLSDLQGIS
jgi:Mce-associated membrane protein